MREEREKNAPSAVPVMAAPKRVPSDQTMKIEIAAESAEIAIMMKNAVKAGLVVNAAARTLKMPDRKINQVTAVSIAYLRRKRNRSRFTRWR